MTTESPEPVADGGPPRVAVVGPTASGKSAVAMHVARRLGDVELISVDSMQVYRGMDIGTAKATPEERRDIEHHGIDLVDPTVDFTVADFKLHVRAALAGISKRSRRAIFVGGTGLYHRVVIDEFDLPGQWPDVRRELDSEPDTAELHQRLVRLDPDAAAKMEPTNRRRVLRALEVSLGSGRRFSSFGPGVDRYPLTVTGAPRVPQIGLRWPREVLSDRIAERVASMIEFGLVAEVARLHEVGMSRTAAQALGYKETVEYLEGRMSHDEAVELTIRRTRQFAVRQERWFRRDPRVRWIDIEHDAVAEASDAVIDALETATGAG